MLLAGTVRLYIGGAEKDVQRFLPVTETLSNRIHHVGKLGDGASAKLVNNMMWALADQRGNDRISGFQFGRA